MRELILSNDVRAYIKKTGHKFTDFEQATLIYNSGWSLEEMHKELKEISIRTSDVSLKRQIDERLEWDHSCIENIKEAQGNCIYKLEVWYEEDAEYEEELYFSTYSLVKNFADTCPRKKRIVKIDVCQNETHWDEHKIFYADIANVYFDENGNLTDYWLKDAEPEFFWNSEERRFEDTYVNIPHPFEDGDIVRIVGTDEVGIVRFQSGLDKEAQNRHMQELVKEDFVDYSDSCITVEFIGKKSAFEHNHILPQMLEYIELPDSDFRKKPLEFARKLIQGKCLIQEFQMICEGLT
jgi:hypothetical protein